MTQMPVPEPFASGTGGADFARLKNEKVAACPFGSFLEHPLKLSATLDRPGLLGWQHDNSQNRTGGGSTAHYRA